MDSTEDPAALRAQRRLPRWLPTNSAGRLALGVTIGVWLVALTLELSRRIALVPDSLNNHAHVWWIAENLWHHGTLPWHMPILGHGAAFTFPYGIVNWTSAAIVWPLLGDWGVTLWTVLGTIGCLAATFYAFPELRRDHWWTAAALANPAAWYGLLFAQQTFVWSAALLLAGIALWRRNRPLGAAVLVGLAQANHPAVVLPIGFALVVAWSILRREDRRRVWRYYALALLISIPPAVLVFDSPVYADSTMRDRVFNFIFTILPRLLVVGFPLLFVFLWRKRPQLAPLAFAGAIIATLALWFPLGANRTVPGLLGRRKPDNASVRAVVSEGVFRRGATYRVLRAPSDSKYTLYEVLRFGGRSDSEFFPESMAQRSFKTPEQYGTLLCRRGVDYVWWYPSYNRTNEPSLLAHAAVTGTALGPVHVRVVNLDPSSILYAVDRHGCPARPSPSADGVPPSVDQPPAPITMLASSSR